MIIFIRPTPLPPNTTLSIMWSRGIIPPNGVSVVVHIVDRTGRERRCCGCEHRGLGDAKPHFLAFHAAHGLCQPDFCQRRVALAFPPRSRPLAQSETGFPIAMKMLRPSRPKILAVRLSRPSIWGIASGCIICDNRSRRSRLRSRTILPKVITQAPGRSIMEYSSIKLEMMVGFSIGVAEFAPKNPPPLCRDA